MSKTVSIARVLMIASVALGAAIGAASAQQMSNHQNDHDPLQPWNHQNFAAQGNIAYYNGYTGYSTERPGYVQYNGYWFPPEALDGGYISNDVLTRAR